MSRTRKTYPSGCFRNPRGHRQALIEGVKPKKVPPSAWDDIAIDKQCWTPYRVAEGMVKKFEQWEDIVEHLVVKFGMNRRDAEKIVESVWYKKPVVPEGLVALGGKEKRLSRGVVV